MENNYNVLEDISENELKGLYAFLSLEWDSYTEKERESWTDILNIIEDHIEKNKKL